MAKNPVTHVLTPKEYLQCVAEGKMPPMGQSSNDERTSEECDRERQHGVYDDGILRR